jgi:hypothetical protein
VSFEAPRGLEDGGTVSTSDLLKDASVANADPVVRHITGNRLHNIAYILYRPDLINELTFSL